MMTRKTPERLTLLENGFSSERLHMVALKEANSKRPVYQIHKWWARRLGSVFRSLLISSSLQDGQTMNTLWHQYYNGASLKGKILADLMMGGGTSIIEGLRLGCKVIGVDVNPVAWFITKKEVEPFDVRLAEHYFLKLKRGVGKEILRYYKTNCPKDHNADLLYVIWAQQVKCKNCRDNITLLHDHIIFENQKSKVLVCPNCLKIFDTKSTKQRINCKFCNHRFGIRERVVSRGIYTCPRCNTKETILEAVKRYGKPLSHKMLCIEYQCEICGRGYKNPNSLDESLYERSVRDFNRERRKLHYPRQRIVTRERQDKRPVSHGYKFFNQLFNPRQLLCLSKLLNAIKHIEDENMQEFFLLTFSSCLETNNKFCKYESKWDKISAMFGIPGYHPIERYGENNVWGSNYGRGTFAKCFQKLKRGKQFTANTFERVYRGETMHKKNVGEQIAAKLATNYPDLKNKNALLICQDSRKVTAIPDAVVDIILTDPPYFDNLVYSELADFFYVWLRLILKEKYDWFKPETSRSASEIILNHGKNRAMNTFVSSLSRVFGQCHRILKDNGIMVFTFHHTKPWAWEGIRNAIENSGFMVTATPVIRSEGRTGYRKGNNISYDVCVVCRKKKQDRHLDMPLDGIISNSIKKMKELYRVDNSIRDNDIFTIIMSEYLRSDIDSSDELFKNESLIQIVKNKVIRNT